MSIVVDTAARQPVATDVEGDALERSVAEAYRRIQAGEYRHAAWQQGAVLIQRTDQTAEAKRAKWERDFYDINKAGRRMRRFKRPTIEREWEDMVKRDRAAAREASRINNAGRG